MSRIGLHHAKNFRSTIYHLNSGVCGGSEAYAVEVEEQHPVVLSSYNVKGR